jgi:hypothetical protein
MTFYTIVHNDSLLASLFQDSLLGTGGPLADGSYDSKENFRYLYDNNIEAAIKV